MSFVARTSPLLALPLELRLKIYEQLLSPETERVYTLYHDRIGQASSGRGRRKREYRISGNTLSRIDPTVLRVNQQIYSEAVSILYESNEYRIYLATPVCLQCTGGNYPDGMADPADLFRNDTNGSAKKISGAEASSSESLNECLDFTEQPERLKVGIIYPHCFRRLRHINLTSARHAIWGDSEGGDYFSHIGEAIWKILKVLAEEQATGAPLKNHLTFTIEAHWLRGGEKAERGHNDMDKKTKPILGMMKALQRRTDIEIEVEEETFTKPLREMQMDECEVDWWEQALLADMTDTMKYFGLEPA